MTAPESNITDRFLSVAELIAHDLCDRSIHSGGLRTWLVRPDYTATVDDGSRIPAGGSLYAGSAGIALFLARTGALIGSQPLLAAARQGAYHAFDSLRHAGSPGFWTGITGAMYAGVTIAELTGDGELIEVASDALAELDKTWKGTNILDVIGGEAGIITGLLWLSSKGEFECARDLAVRMGNYLISSAIRLPEGWAWGTMPAARKPLTGYAHGASGFSHALAELAAVTGDTRFLYAACQGVLYERAQFDSVVLNWPDYRNTKVSGYLMDGGIHELSTLLMSGADLNWKPGQQMHAWCHGAPGVGYSRHRIAQLTGNEGILNEARLAADSTQGSLARLGNNFTLCHGIGGNADFLVAASESTGVDISNMLDRFDQAYHEIHLAGRDWQSGTSGGTEDVTLMLGTAGVGFSFLRVAGLIEDSPLLPTPVTGEPIPCNVPIPEEVLELFSDDISRLYPRFINAGGVSYPAQNALTELLSAPLEEVIRFSRREKCEPALSEAESYALECDRAASKLLGKDLDLLRDLLDEITAQEIKLRTSHFARSHRTAWLPAQAPASENGGVILLRNGLSVTTIALSPLAAFLLQKMDTPISFEALLGQLTDVMPPQSTTPADVLLERQLSHFLEAGIIAAQFPGHSYEEGTAQSNAAAQN